MNRCRSSSDRAVLLSELAAGDRSMLNLLVRTSVCRTSGARPGVDGERAGAEMRRDQDGVGLHQHQPGEVVDDGLAAEDEEHLDVRPRGQRR